jgi:hypothetical protein
MVSIQLAVVVEQVQSVQQLTVVALLEEMAA